VYQGQIEKIFGWDKLCFMVVKLLGGIPELEIEDEGSNCLDRHHTCLKFMTNGPEGSNENGSDSEEGESESWAYHWLEVNDEDIEPTIRVLELMPDFRRMNTWFINFYDPAFAHYLPKLRTDISFSNPDHDGKDNVEFINEELFDFSDE
jgi:hypothetical protein